MTVYPKTLCIKCRGWNMVQYPMKSVCLDCGRTVTYDLAKCPLKTYDGHLCGVRHSVLRHFFNQMKYWLLWKFVPWVFEGV
jgi:hypothetical protein